jgi:hypothetical protein
MDQIRHVVAELKRLGSTQELLQQAAQTWRVFLLTSVVQLVVYCS